ncbi:hypothetical protein CDAR_243421 [Caerostris darwini]|uniref:Uncharacterized protein n=1 Tax=Caerostris darwini TaxID=1538125 RepID=A0AAV4US69_9ARAC|nr:hypothetical protein CDAR_243421 [Caerostris darwini]
MGYPKRTFTSVLRRHLCRRAYVDPIRQLHYPGPQTSIRLWISQPVRKPTKSHKSVSTTRCQRCRRSYRDYSVEKYELA